MNRQIILAAVVATSLTGCVSGPCGSQSAAEPNPLVGVWFQRDAGLGGHHVFTIRADGTAILTGFAQDRAWCDTPHPYTLDADRSVMGFKGIDFSYKLRPDKDWKWILTLKHEMNDGRIMTESYRLITDNLKEPTNKTSEASVAGAPQPQR